MIVTPQQITHILAQIHIPLGLNKGHWTTAVLPHISQCISTIQRRNFIQFLDYPAIIYPLSWLTYVWPHTIFLNPAKSLLILGQVKLRNDVLNWFVTTFCRRLFVFFPHLCVDRTSPLISTTLPKYFPILSHSDSPCSIIGSVYFASDSTIVSYLEKALMRLAPAEVFSPWLIPVQDRDTSSVEHALVCFLPWLILVWDGEILLPQVSCLIFESNHHFLSKKCVLKMLMPLLPREATKVESARDRLSCKKNCMF